MTGTTPETPRDPSPDDSTGPEPNPEETNQDPASGDTADSAVDDSAADTTVPPDADGPAKSTLLSDEATLPPRAAGPASATEAVASETPLQTDQDDDATLPPRAAGDLPGRDVETIISTASGESGSGSAAGTHVQYFGEYELLQEIARGGMGVVYKARQSRLNRTVALKMILSGQLASQDDVQRFYIEAEAAASLEHPGIVPIYEIGEHEGQHFFSMGFIDGAGLDVQVKNGPMPPREAAAVTQQVCEAIAYAHSQNVIHRDLKPANVLIDDSGQARVTDFGLAKKTDADSGLTATGQILGTPGYMPPEQASGESGTIGPAADIYSLGAILYALLTGRPPFQSGNVMDTLTAVLEQKPVPPSQLNPHLDPSLEKLCLKCLEKDPSSRYASADELIRDLRKYMDGESLSVESKAPLTMIRKTLARSRHDKSVGEWGALLCWIAPVVGCAEMAVAWLCWDTAWDDSELRKNYPQPSVISLRIVQCLAIALIAWLYRTVWTLKVGAVERQLIATCTAFFAGCATILFTVKLGVGAWGLLDKEFYPYRPGEDFVAYQFLFLISGFFFASLGANYWGGCYVVAACFFLLAPVSVIYLPIAPVLFGLTWTIVLLVTGRRLLSLSRRAGAGPIQKAGR